MQFGSTLASRVELSSSHRRQALPGLVRVGEAASAGPPAGRDRWAPAQVSELLVAKAGTR
jgi:hypothetical protein